MPRKIVSLDIGKADLKALQGEWRRVRIVIAGEAQSEVGQETTVVFAGDRMKYSVAGKPSNEWAIKLLDGKAKHFNRKGLKGAAQGLFYRGLYRLEGGTFTLCSREGKRPGELASREWGVYLEVFEKVKR